MKKIITVLLSMALLSVLAVTPYTVTAAKTTAEEPVGAKSGKTGNCTWTLDDDGVLIISGNGAMVNSFSPWGKDIKSVIIEDLCRLYVIPAKGIIYLISNINMSYQKTFQAARS